MDMRGVRTGLSALILAVVGAVSLARPAAAQQIAFKSDLPRVLVFIQEKGTGQVATTEMNDFLRKAGFPVIDPALAHEAAQRKLVQQALSGDETAATALGRDFGAQVLLLGTADWGARPDPVDGSLITATTEVSIRALRLDRGDVVSSATADSRVIEATRQAARTKAIHVATQKILTTSPLIGKVMNDWDARPWSNAGYWKPDPGSVAAQVKAASAEGTGAPGVAVLQTDVLPSGEAGTRGIGVVKRGSGDQTGLRNTVQLSGVVIGKTRDVKVDGEDAVLSPIDTTEARRLGVEKAQAQRFVRRFDLPISQDSVPIIATGTDGAKTMTVASPRIGQRWAVVIGVSKYESKNIPSLKYASADARSFYHFLKSDRAGPFDHVLLLTDSAATGAAMRKALFVYLQQAKWNDLVVIYFAGHGAPDPNRPDNLYLLPTDAKLDAMASTAFPMWDVKTALRRQISADRVLVIADACHSAGATQGALGGAKSNQIAGSFAQLFTPSRRLIMTAANSNEFSLEGPQWGGHGVFTHYLIEGLDGKADENHNGIVSFQELFDYVSKSVRKATEGRQNPQRAGLGDIPLAVVPAAAEPKE